MNVEDRYIDHIAAISHMFNVYMGLKILNSLNQSINKMCSSFL